MANPVNFFGISFPFRRGPTEYPMSAVDDDLIKSSLLQIILTQRGERIMRPDFGCDAIHYIFDPNDEVMGSLFKNDLLATIGAYEPRVTVIDIAVEHADSTVTLTISYIVNATRQQSSVSETFATGASGI